MSRQPSYAAGVSTVPLLRLTIGEALRKTVERFPDRDALVFRHQLYRASYCQFWDQVPAAAKSLLAIGIDVGQRVGVWAPNRYEWSVAQFATARVGAILVNINPAYKAAELEYALCQSGCTALFLAAGFRGTN